MSAIEDNGNGENGEHEPDLRSEITRELQLVQEMLRDLEAMLPAVHDDVGLINANIDRVREQLQSFDERAEELRESGELREDMETSRMIGKAINSIEAGLQRLLEDREVALDTRMTIEVAIVDLRHTREELLSGFPEDQQH